MRNESSSHRNQTGTACGLASRPAVTNQITSSFLRRDASFRSILASSLILSDQGEIGGDEEDSSREERSGVEARPNSDAVPRAAREGDRAPVHGRVLGDVDARGV